MVCPKKSDSTTWVEWTLCSLCDQQITLKLAVPPAAVAQSMPQPKVTPLCDGRWETKEPVPGFGCSLMISGGPTGVATNYGTPCSLVAKSEWSRSNHIAIGCPLWIVSCTHRNECEEDMVGNYIREKKNISSF